MKLKRVRNGTLAIFLCLLTFVYGVRASEIPVMPSDLTAVTKWIIYAPKWIYTPRIVLGWQDNSDNEDGFEIIRSSNNRDFSLITTLQANTTYYEDEKWDSEQIYFYRIRAYNQKGKSQWANTIVNTPPRRPSNCETEILPGKMVRVTWVDNSKLEQSYIVERSTNILNDYSYFVEGVRGTIIATLPTNSTFYIDDEVAQWEDEKRPCFLFYAVYASHPDKGKPFPSFCGFYNFGGELRTPEVREFLISYLEDEKRGGASVRKYWMPGLVEHAAKSFYALRDYEILDILPLSAKMANAKVRIHSSTKGGFPIIKVWEFRLSKENRQWWIWDVSEQ